ncbi:hypothetical protein CGG92_25105, partial [Vibrio parahaemolyticus]
TLGGLVSRLNYATKPSKIHVNCLLHANAEEKWSEEDRISLFNQDTSDIKSLISVIKNSAKIEMKKYT